MTSSLNPFARAKFLTLRTRLSSQECFNRLQASTLPWFSEMLVFPLAKSTLPLMGWVYPTGFAVRKRILYGNGMQPEAKAKFEAGPSGTRMTVRLGTRRWVTVSNLCCLAVMVFGGGVTALVCRLTGDPRCSGPSIYAVPFAIPAFLGTMLLLSRWWARDQAAFLVTVLKQTLEAEEVPEVGPGIR